MTFLENASATAATEPLFYRNAKDFNVQQPCMAYLMNIDTLSAGISFRSQTSVVQGGLSIYSIQHGGLPHGFRPFHLLLTFITGAEYISY